MIRLKLMSAKVLLPLLAGCALALLTANAATAQDKNSYTYIQVLLPGETPAPGTLTGKTGEPLPQVAGTPFEVRIRICDSSWNVTTYINNTMLFSSTDLDADLPATQPVASGELTVPVKLNTVGFFTITAKDITDYHQKTGTSAAVSVTTGAGEAVALAISTLGPLEIAGQPVSLTVRAIDNEGRDVSGWSGTVQLTQETSQGRGAMSPEAITFSGGRWMGEVTFYLADQSAAKEAEGPVRLLAVGGGFEPISGLSNAFAVAPGDPSRLQLILPGQEPLAATVAGLVGEPVPQFAGYSFTVLLLATDAYWNPVPETLTARLEAADPATSPWTALLDGGQAEIELSLDTPGRWSLTGAAPDRPLIEGMTTAPITVYSAAPNFVIEPLPTPLTAGVPVPVTVRATGPDGQVLSEFNGPAMLVCETGPGSMSPGEIRFTAGVWSGEAAFFGADPEQAFSCVDYSSPPNIGASNRFEVRPGAYAGLQVVLPGQTPQGGLIPGLAGEPLAQAAGSPFAVVVLAVDAWWNHVPTVTDAVHLTAGDPFAEFAADTTLHGGVVAIPVTCFRAGDHAFIATPEGDGKAAFTSAPVTNAAGPSARIILLAPGEELVAGSPTGKQGQVLDQTVDYAFDLDLFATDPWWNPLPGIADRIALSSTDPLAELPPPFALGDGRATVSVRLATGGYQLLTAVNLDDAAIGQAVTQVRASNSGFHIEAELHPASVIAGEPFTLSVAVTNDAGAVMQEINGVIHVEVLNAETGQPARGELSSVTFQLQQGRASLQQTFTGAEPIVLRLSDEAGNAPGVTNLIAVVPGPPAELTFASDPPWVGGLKSATVSAKMGDRFGNGIAQVPVEFSIVAGQGTLEPLDEVTGADGVAHALYTGCREPEMGMIQASAPGFTTSLSIETALLAPDSAGGTVSNYPNPFHPGEAPTTITYQLDDDARVTLRIFTLSGRLVLRTDYEAGDTGGSAGPNEITWDGRNGDGDWVASGGYIALLEAVRGGETLHKMRRRIGVVR